MEHRWSTGTLLRALLVASFEVGRYYLFSLKALLLTLALIFVYNRLVTEATPLIPFLPPTPSGWGENMTSLLPEWAKVMHKAPKPLTKVRKCLPKQLPVKTASSRTRLQWIGIKRRWLNGPPLGRY